MEAPRKVAGATLETCLAEARAGTSQPVYLFDGDAFLSLRSARELAALASDLAGRGFPVETLDIERHVPALVRIRLTTSGDREVTAG